jgi:hypothetical protein
MNKNVKARITGDGVKGFFDRAREHARKLDRGDEVAPEITVSFENASDMMRVLSAQRTRLLRVARKKETPVSDLAVDLKRDTRAVGLDYYEPGTRRTRDMENGESLNLVPRSINSQQRFSCSSSDLI